MPTASPTATISAASESAPARSPARTRFDRRLSSAVPSTVRTPASRACSTSRAESTDQVSKSQVSEAIRQASGSQPRPSSVETSPVRTAVRAASSTGAAAAYPSVVLRARPFRSRSPRVGSAGFGASRMASATSVGS